jgi:hypothetical protein
MLRAYKTATHLLKSCALLAISLAWALIYLTATGTAQQQTAQPELNVQASFSAQTPVAPDAPIELRLNRPLAISEGRLAVLLGQTDLTALFKATENALRYSPPALPLPLGDIEVTVYLVSPRDEWKLLARFPLRVAAKASAPATQNAPPAEKPKQLGFDKFIIAPTLTLGVKSQVAETHFPAASRPLRPTFADAIVRAGLRTQMTREGFNLQSQFDLAGSSFQREALRFGVLGKQAPHVDLSSYTIQLQTGRSQQSRLLSGNATFGTHRHLVNNYESRGVTLLLPLGARSTLALAALNGTRIVGFDNFFGLEERRHQVQSATWGFEFLPKRPGGLRLETSYLNGSLLPRNHFNQNTVTDTERSRGWGLRLLASDAAQRWQLEGGFARSRFTNPSDPLLNQSFSVVPVQATTRNARYLDASYQLLRELAVSKTRKANLTLSLRHERVDPLFRGIGAGTQADLLQNQVDLIGSLGEVSINASFGGFNNNLDELPALLKTLTRRRAFNLNTPLAPLLKLPEKQSVWWPRIAFSYDRTHQFAPTVPRNGGFDGNDNNLSFIPNQVSLNQFFTADWQLPKWRFGYRLNRSFQDNRQIRREFADLQNLVNVFTLGLSPSTRLDVNFELHAESAENRETQRTDRTLRFNLNLNWRMTQKMTLTANFANTTLGDLARTASSRNTDFNLQWSRRWVFNEQSRFRKLQAQFFIIYANRYAHAHDTVFGLNNLRKTQTLNSGLNFTFF